MNPLAPYERLVGLAQLEAGLVASQAWEDLERLASDRQAILATLPHTPPAEAAPVLERLAGIQGVVTAALAAARAETATELRTLGRGRGAVRGYAASTATGVPGPARLDGAA